MIWRPDLLTMTRSFLLALAIFFLLSGTVMLTLALGLHSPWYRPSAHLAARYAVLFLAIAAACTFALKLMERRRR